MPQTLNILFLTAEAEPFIKVGGLGDVAGSLPRALRALSTEELKLDVRIVLPYHPALKVETLKPLGVFPLSHAGTESAVEVFDTSLYGTPTYLIGGDPIRANGSVYSMNAGLDAEKYAFFSFAALELGRFINWAPDILHGNDWHTSLALYGMLAKHWQGAAPRLASLLTIHNLPFMGPDISGLLQDYGYPLAQTDLPEWARVMPLPLGLWSADAIVAVSPTYGREILTPEFGCGLDGFLRSRGEAVQGILNGLDTASFDPAHDPALAANFDAASLDARAANKAALQARLGLPVLPETPLLALISRMDVQKGVDLAFSALKAMKNIEWQAVILGTGDPRLEAEAMELQAALPDRVRVETRYDGTLARQIYAGSDIFLMPSRYEPCGLSQMISMRYGSVPVVRAAGGLNDTVQHEHNGFVFEKAHHLSLVAAIKAALKAFSQPETWRSLQLQGMSQDFSWRSSAQKYLDLYLSILKSS